MIWQRIFTIAGAIALGALAWNTGGWSGLAFLVSGVVLWFMLNYTRLITIMKRAADRPIGYVDSAVMLNTKLRPKLPLMHVIALTRSLGKRLTDEGVEPEIYVWSDNGDSQVTCEFEGGRLVRWQLERPTETGSSPQPAPEGSHEA